MIDFLKKLFSRRKEKVSILLFDQENPHLQDNFTFKPKALFFLTATVFLVLLAIVLLILYATPTGSYLFNKEDRNLRANIIEIGERVRALQDSLHVRDQQLYDIQRVIRNSEDTVFYMAPTHQWQSVYGAEEADAGPHMLQMAANVGIQSLTGNQILSSDIFSGIATFPVESPVNGSITAHYQPDKGHYGIDIAASIGADVRSIADGVVIGSDWTINNGYVIQILHPEGLLSVYKHFSRVFFGPGDIVRKNDIIGTVGETGLLASGPHVHFELWKNGIALDPTQYITIY